MDKRRRRYLMGMVVALLLIWIIADATNEPGVSDLSANFEEVTMYRNENNTGPIVRIYAVTLTDTIWSEMKEYGNFMPHTKYGNTKVYFFRKGSPVPDKVSPGADNINPELKKYVLAVYEKDAMGTVSFRKYPFL